MSRKNIAAVTVIMLTRKPDITFTVSELWGDVWCSSCGIDIEYFLPANGVIHQCEESLFIKEGTHIKEWYLGVFDYGV